MYTLADFIALNERPQLFLNVINTIRMSSNFLDTAQYLPIAGGSARFTQRNTFPTVAARAINGALPAESTGTFNNVVENLSVYTGNSRIDPAYAKFQNKSETDLQTLAIMDQSKSLAKTFEADIFSGVGVDDISGFNQRLTAIGGEQLFALGVNGLDITASAANAQTFFDALFQLVGAVYGPDDEKIIVANRTTLQKIQSAASRLSYALASDKNSLGRQISLWGSTPFVLIERDSTNTEILPTNEVQGGSGAHCSSIYCIRWNSNEGATLLTLPGQGTGIDMSISVLPRASGQAYGEVVVETYMGLAMLRDDCAARMTGIIVN
jgi:hypothetical protein